MHRRKKWQLRDPGCGIDYRQLFVYRMKRDGRFKEFRETRQRIYDSSAWDERRGRPHSFQQTFWPAAREMGYISKADELARYEDYMLHGSRTLMNSQLDDMKQEIAREQAEGEAGAAPDFAALPADISWIYNHPAMLRTPSDGIVRLSKKDMIGAPSKGACGMLAHYVNNRKDFYKMVMQVMTKKETAEDEWSRDDFLSAEGGDFEAIMSTM